MNSDFLQSASWCSYFGILLISLWQLNHSKICLFWDHTDVVSDPSTNTHHNTDLQLHKGNMFYLFHVGHSPLALPSSKFSSAEVAESLCESETNSNQLFLTTLMKSKLSTWCLSITFSRCWLAPMECEQQDSVCSRLNGHWKLHTEPFREKTIQVSKHQFCNAVFKRLWCCAIFKSHLIRMSQRIWFGSYLIMFII